MTLSTAHTSAKAADVAKLLLLNNIMPGNTYPPMRSMAVTSPKRNPNSTLTLP